MRDTADVGCLQAVAVFFQPMPNFLAVRPQNCTTRNVFNGAVKVSVNFSASGNRRYERIGYALVSKDGQNFDLQDAAMHDTEAQFIYVEVVSNRVDGCTEPDHCIMALRTRRLRVLWRLNQLE
ncbi:hypothetical protein [Cupriavidus nantongensis]|uniref:hypothetical protein n=1 Tax=Cupriavidus nantongensis TaxID=1796606 RepID=UPI0035900F9B